MDTNNKYKCISWHTISIHLPGESETLLYTLLKEGFILYELSKAIHSYFLILFKLRTATAVRNIQHFTVSGLGILSSQNNTAKRISNKRMSYVIWSEYQYFSILFLLLLFITLETSLCFFVAHKKCPSARCTTVANFVCSDIGIFIKHIRPLKQILC